MIRANTKKFLDAVEAAVANSKLKTMALVQATLAETNNAIVARTPVGKTGFLRNSWYGLLNEAPPERVSGKLLGAGQGEPPNLAVAKMKLGDKLYFYNATPYAVFVEFGTIHMAPRAFLRGGLADFAERHNKIGLKINLQAQSYGWTHGDAWRAFVDGAWVDNPVRPLPR